MSARRQARAGGGAHAAVAAAGTLEDWLRDRDATVWHHFDEYAALFQDKGWELPLKFMWHSTHPQNRRAHAAEQWGVENGHGRDWHLLRRLGFIG